MAATLRWMRYNSKLFIKVQFYPLNYITFLFPCRPPPAVAATSLCAVPVRCNEWEVTLRVGDELEAPDLMRLPRP